MHDQDVARANLRGHFRQTHALTFLDFFTLCRADRTHRFETAAYPFRARSQGAARRTCNGQEEHERRFGHEAERGPRPHEAQVKRKEPGGTQYDERMALLDVVLGYDCNLACTYCTITQEMRLRALPTERVAKEIDRAAVRGFREVAFTGGEPTIRSDLPTLVKYAKKRGFVDVKVASNGLRYAHMPYLEMLAKAGVNQFHVSMHAFEDLAYDTTVQREGAAALRKQAIANLIALDLNPIADLILKEDTYRDTRAWVLALAKQGVRHFRLWLVSLTDGNAKNTHQLPRISIVAEAVKEALDAARANDLDVRSLHIPRCFLHGYEDHVMHPGADLVTVVTPDDVFDLKNSRLSGGVKPRVCQECKFFDVCPGLRADYVALHGDREPHAVVDA